MVNMSKPINKKFLQLLEDIPDTKEYYDKGLIKFISVEAGTKKPRIPKGVKYTYDYVKANPDVFDVTQFKEKDNIALLRGYEHIGVLDIDGVKHIGDDKNQALKKYILDIIKSIDYPFIIQETQSHGYHCLYYTNDDGKFNLSNIFWPVERPDDFPEEIDTKTYKENLSNQTLGSNVIEIFQKFNGFIVFAPSNTKDDEYKLLENNYTWKQIFNKPVTGMETKIDDVFKAKGFYVRERSKDKGYGVITNNLQKVNTLVGCTPEAIQKLTRLTVELYIEAHKHTAKYYSSLYIGGYYSKYITMESTEAIYEGIKDGVKNIMEPDCIDTATSTALHNYEVPDDIKKTLKGVEEHNNHTPEIKRILKDITEVIYKDTHGETKTVEDKPATKTTPKSYEEVAEMLEAEHEARQKKIQNNTNNTNNDKVFNYSNKNEGSFLTVDAPVKYRINNEHNDKLQRAKNDIKKLFKGKDKSVILRLINGGFKHYSLPSEIKLPGTKQVYDPDKLYYIGESKLYGFPKLKEIIRYNTNGEHYQLEVNVEGEADQTEIIEIKTQFEDTEQKEALGKVYTLKRVIEEMTVLNPSYYVCEGFAQLNNELYTSSEGSRNKIGFFAFKDIKKVQVFDPVKRVISNKQTYDFEIMTQEGETSKYESFTIDDIVLELYNRGLLLKDTSEFKSKILTFIMETNKKQGLEIVNRPITEGFYYDVKHGEILYYLPELEVGKYSLKEGVETLNDVFDRIFAGKIKYSTIFLAELLQTLCNVFKDVGLANGVNKHLLLLQMSGTLKTMVLEMINFTFKAINRFEETNDGDTKSAILRLANKSTLPQTLNDPKIGLNTKDFKDITKALAFGYTGDNLANDQYGNKTNTRDAMRLLAVSHNEGNLILDKEGGEPRRLNIAVFTEADTPTKEQKEAINEYLTPIKGEVKLRKLNAIGEAWTKFIIKYFQEYTPEMNQKLHKTGGWCLIDDFLHYLEAETGIPLNKGFYNRYEWDDLTENEVLVLRSRLRYDYETKLKSINKNVIYDIETVENYFSVSNMFLKREMKNKADEWVLLKNEFEEFVKSPGGLNRNISGDDILKLLEIQKPFKRMKYNTANEDTKENKITCMVITPSEILEYFYNEVTIIDDDM